MGSCRLFGGVAAAALLLAPGAALAQDAGAALEVRIAQLEAELNSLKSEVAAARTQQASQAQDIIRLETRPAPAPTPVSAPATPSDGFRIGDHTVKFGGFIKTDFMASKYSGGDPANGDPLRDYHLPGAIPVGGTDEDVATDFNARQTRFWLTTDGVVAGHKIGTRLEMDFQTLPGSGDQRTTSGSNPALRRAFVTIDNWLIGQEWTNFQNTAVLPESADFVGAAEGTVFARQAQVRYTRGPFSIALENPETTVTPFGGGARIVADDNSLPDLTARYALSRPWGDVQLSGLVRQLKYQNPATNIDRHGLGPVGLGQVQGRGAGRHPPDADGRRRHRPLCRAELLQRRGAGRLGRSGGHRRGRGLRRLSPRLGAGLALQPDLVDAEGGQRHGPDRDRRQPLGPEPSRQSDLVAGHGV